MVTTRRKRNPRRPPFADSTWATLAAAASEPPSFDPATLGGLPPPAQRLLARALPAGVTLSPMVELAMEGEIKLGGRWLGFTAEHAINADPIPLNTSVR